ncbi:hypothetical protein KJ059_08325 [Myxococcota bacterium]|nr:hypothetical protein [Myxococcota bacterium]MCZ7619928.1 hypothetical protein [Myxococcota bacterium]
MPRPRFAHLLTLVTAGLALRLVLIVAAENRLDADEATVGVMALDILDGLALPAFFYGNFYNGGGALEAYLAAPVFSLLGPSAIALKLCMLGLWVVTALLFADLCRRTLSSRQALSAVAFFALATPFFLEWSLKARGGFAETVLFSVALLWIAALPAGPLATRRTLQCLLFGAAAGVGIWASEMLAPMLALAGVWLVLRSDPPHRKQVGALLVCGIALGLVPLLAYNATHDWLHLRSLTLHSLLTTTTPDRVPLSLEQLQLSAVFVLGRAWPILLAGLGVAAVRLARDRSRVSLGHVAVAHLLVYLLAYWMSGLRHLPVPPSRVLYAVYPGLAVLLAYAVDTALGSGRAIRLLAAGAIGIWLVSVSVSTFAWMKSGVPREANSWRGSWALTNSDDLDERLIEADVDVAYSSYWTTWPLRFSSRARRHHDPGSAELRATWQLEKPSRDTTVAFVLHSAAPLSEYVESALRKRRAQVERRQWEDFTVFLVKSPSPETFRDIPRRLMEQDWIPAPAVADGFN